MNASKASTGQPSPNRGARGVEYALADRRARYEDEVSKLFDATLSVMREKETADPTVNDILDRAAMSTTTFYRHFPTKGDLLVALLEQAHEMTATHIEQRVASVDDPRDRIERWVRAVIDLVRTPASLTLNRPLLLAHPRLLHDFPEEITTGFAMLALPLQAAIADARTATGLAPGDSALDSRLALHQVFAILIDAAAVGMPPTPGVVEGVVDYTLRAALGTSLGRRIGSRTATGPGGGS
jgi:AcrR family transcriptional regulator